MGRELTIIAQYTVSANLPANSIVTVSFTVDPSIGSENQIFVPKGYQLVIKDIYSTTTPSVDALVSFYKNNEELMLTTDPVSTLGVSNPARPKYKPLVIDEQNYLNAKAITLAAGGTAASTDTFYIKAELVEKKSGAVATGGAIAKLKAMIKK